MLASCAGSAIDNKAATLPKAANESEAQESADAANIVVTGSRVRQQNLEMAAPVSVIGSQAYAPPPPSAPGLSGGWAPPYHDEGRDKFTSFAENSFHIVREAPVSTFSIDVDTASYSWVRASLNQNVLPQPAAVRTEEMVNYFHYDYAPPATTSQPFSTNVAVFPSPWAVGRQLVRIGIKGFEVRRAERPRANLVFLIDTSGSMQEPNKLPLVQRSLSMLVNELDERDTVAIVTYAGSAGTALAPTPVAQKRKILDVINQLGAGGSTAGAEGIRQAYHLAEANLDPRGVNRVILATDGDFNVGITDQGELKGYIERERSKGVFLSVLGFGMGNYNDALMQALAQNGNGTAAYIDTVQEAKKTLVEEAGSTLFPIAKDVKIQVEFNPLAVAEYRLIGYETRALNRDDFDNDKVDAGDVGSGQSVTALYEVVPVGGPLTNGGSRYSPEIVVTGLRIPRSPQQMELGFVKIRYKLPKSDTSKLISTPIDASVQFASFEAAPRDARFATAVAGFAELLRGGRYNGSLTYDDVLRIAAAARGPDEYGYRSEFLQLVRNAKGARSLAALGQ
ncbi:VWA domain-containing protein [Sphingomonas sp.]|uniref:vWA domain-containing protein n=1 Tax=Sphingomonas sp. TaxID=28214 RepID=UPI0025E09A96|nr:VWA domain-containing protein [Sphingomonas sp.]